MKALKFAVVGVTWATLAAAVQAQPSAASAAGAGQAQQGQQGRQREQARARIQTERTRIESRFNAEMAACQQRFVVTACMDEARQRRREALAVPRAEGLALDDIERRERAVARRELLQAKQREAAVGGAPALSASAPFARVRPGAEAASAASAPQRRKNSGDAAAAAETAAQARSRAARERQAEIEATQARILARQAERLREGKAAAPLPVPSAAR